MPKPKPEPGTPADLRERALRLLARREHSRFELTRKLETAGFSRAEIDPLLDQFEAKNWLSDRRFAESWVADHRAKSGGAKLAYELRLRGLPDTVIDQALSGNRISELERARTVWEKKFGSPPNNDIEKAKQIRFMQGRGFTFELIRKIIKGTDQT